MPDLTSLPPELLFYAAILVILAKLVDRLFDLVQELIKTRLNGKGKDEPHDESDKVDLVKMAGCLEETAEWHRREGPGLVRGMNAVADHVAAQTSVLQLLQRRQEDTHSVAREIQRTVMEKLH